MVARRPLTHVAVVVAAVLGGSTALAGSAEQNLVVTRVAVAQRGATVQIRTMVRNVGPVASPPSIVGYYLGRVRIGAHRLGKLQAHVSSSWSSAIGIPRSMPTGAYRLRACTNDHGRLRLSNCRAAMRTVKVPDQAPPAFAGLSQAVTCIPGPVQPGSRPSRYRLSWTPASDADTPPSLIVYDVYQSTTPGAENFATPTYTSAPGATTFTTPLLSNDNTWYFVVRARDQAGNRDSNTVERRGFNQCV